MKDARMEREPTLSMAQLRLRGWSATMATRLLGEADLLVVDPRGARRGKVHHYHEERVVAAEATEAFLRLKAESERRSAIMKAATGRKRADRIARIEALNRAIEEMPLDLVRRLAILQHSRSMGLDESVVALDAILVDRLAVMVLFDVTAPLDALLSIHDGDAAGREARMKIASKTFEAIATRHPELRAQCRDREDAWRAERR